MSIYKLHLVLFTIHIIFFKLNWIKSFKTIKHKSALQEINVVFINESSATYIYMYIIYI
jgi:hypothetical protein